ncbi:BatA domain-containing protein [Winogradskyella maritima]|uniref:BatA domain-containing protein n=1 Tax=Winogradskyella maritima TaxID=1517766 RepID=A0ABV8AIT8_9FLAO|nr:BatA domain-containing protein [Winogradskyella maritima]
MQFKHPELLWALLLLLIPIIIHLFQLRRFQKVAFTNVKFLQNVVQQTRKSSQIKKWLILFTRLFLLACLVLAFAQTYTSNSESFKTKNETVIYLDNSYSMQAKGPNGSLMNDAVQSLISSLPSDEKFTLFTNDSEFKNTTTKTANNALVTLKYSTKQLPYDAVMLKGKQYFSNDVSTLKNFVVVSDFQQQDRPLEFEKDSTIQLRLVQLKPNDIPNISIDSVYVNKVEQGNLELKVMLQNTGNSSDNSSISLYDGEELLAKTAVNLNESDEATFTIPENKTINGRLTVDDNALQYDNTFYFNINQKDKIKVLAINEANGDFLSNLYTDDEFEFEGLPPNNVNYNRFSEQNLIILNGLKRINNALNTSLLSFMNDGGNVLIIPSSESDLTSYNQLLNRLKLSTFESTESPEKRITTINYDHPLISNTFSSRVDNFQYPKVTKSFKFSSSSNSVYNYDDGTSFLKGNNGVYAFSAGIDDANSNFKNSPLIVPILYNLGKQSLELSELYYTVGASNSVDVNVQLGQDDILSLEKDGESGIPLQQTFSKKVNLKLEDFPETAGIWQVKNKSNTLQNISFNYNRDESNLAYYTLNSTGDYDISTALDSAIADIKSQTNVNELWKWFVIFALIFLLTEMLILKYLK